MTRWEYNSGRITVLIGILIVLSIAGFGSGGTSKS